jgi:hypothetical protein
MVLFGEVYMMLNSPEEPYLEQNDPLSTWKTVKSRNFSFQKLTLFSQGNNVLDTAASNIDRFLWRESEVSSTQLNSPIWSKESLCPPANT